MRALSWAFVLLASIIYGTARAGAFMYAANCTGSFSRQGSVDEDLSHGPGKPISCTNLILSISDNGHILIQLANKLSDTTPVGFAGDGFDYEANDHLLTLPLRALYLEQKTNPGRPEYVQGVDGYCFLEGELNIRSLKRISCVAKLELGPERILYKVDARITGVGKTIPF